jgi:RNA polymerase sigma-70 factor (ECF subfamily)
VITGESRQQVSYLHDPDVQLMLRVQKGDDEAFNQLVQTYQDRLVGLFSHLIGDRESAEDLAQDVFLRIYRSRERYTPTARFSTWLFRIANNVASNSRRAAGRRKEVPLSVNDSGPLGPRPQEKLLADKSALMPARQADKREMRRIVQEALNELNDRQRMALLLHKFEGMSYEDIAHSMELTTQAVKSLLSRARENLRLKLEPHLS